MFLRLAALFIKIQMNIITGLLAVIKQWGQNQTQQDRSNTFSFPLSFSTNQVQVVGIGTATYNEWQNGIVITAVTASNFTEHCRSSAQIFRWIAVGH